MIASIVDGSIPKKRVLVRGRDLAFWISEQFSSIAFLTWQDLFKKKWDFLLVFSASYFPLLGPEDEIALVQFLQAREAAKAALWTLPHFPFFALSRKYAEVQRREMKAGLFETLCRLQPRRFLKMPGCFPLLSSERDILAITDAVLELQARKYRETGVLILDPRNFFIEGLPPVGRGSEIATGVVLCGQSSIGQHVRLSPHCYIENCTIGDRSVIFPHSVLVDARIEEDVCVGPFAHLREGACVRRGAKVGNFVEMKKSALGRGSKAMHLSYLGDAEIGEQVNIGAGTITCNYDGEKKNPTFIEDNVFIGSNSALIAPLTVQRGSYVAAGSTITENVPAGALAIARQRQRNISGWVARKKKEKK